MATKNAVDGKVWFTHYAFNTFTCVNPWNHDPLAVSTNPYAADNECTHGWLPTDGEKISCECWTGGTLPLSYSQQDATVCDVRSTINGSTSRHPEEEAEERTTIETSADGAGQHPVRPSEWNGFVLVAPRPTHERDAEDPAEVCTS
jgi:hypothetical protein